MPSLQEIGGLADHLAVDRDLLEGLVVHERRLVAVEIEELHLLLVEPDALDGLLGAKALVGLVAASRRSRISIWAKAPPLPGWTSSRFTTSQSLPWCSSTLPGLMSMALIFMALPYSGRCAVRWPQRDSMRQTPSHDRLACARWSGERVATGWWRRDASRARRRISPCAARMLAAIRGFLRRAGICRGRHAGACR